MAAVTVAGACGGSNKSTTTGTPSAGTSSAAGALKIGLGFDIGGRGDKSFNDAAAAGVTKAQTELGVSAGQQQ